MSAKVTGWMLDTISARATFAGDSGEATIITTAERDALLARCREADALELERDKARATNQRLNRRVQELDSEVARLRREIENRAESRRRERTILKDWKNDGRAAVMRCAELEALLRDYRSMPIGPMAPEDVHIVMPDWSALAARADKLLATPAAEPKLPGEPQG